MKDLYVYTSDEILREGIGESNVRRGFIVAEDYSKQSNCLKKRVGACLAVIDSSGEMTAWWGGFGGTSKRLNSPCSMIDGKCPRKRYDWAQDGCWSIHAEQRAIMKALAEVGCGNTDLEHILNPGDMLVMFVTHGPCDQCLKFMQHVGVSVVVYDIDYKTNYNKWDGHIRILKK